MLPAVRVFEATQSNAVYAFIVDVCVDTGLRVWDAQRRASGQFAGAQTFLSRYRRSEIGGDTHDERLAVLGILGMAPTRFREQGARDKILHMPRR